MYFCSMKSPYQEIKGLLMESNMPEGEAKAVALMLLEKVAGLPTAKALIADGNDLLCRRQSLLELAARVAQGEPVQYVLGEADFCGLTLKVKPGVLIPRPETEELVAWVEENVKGNSNLLPLTSNLSPFKLLDIGTGSGCIAVALAKKLKEAEVEAWDVSDDALEIARENAKRNGVQVKTSKVDVLDINANSNSQLSTVNFQLSTLTSHLSPLIISSSATLPTSAKKRRRRWRGTCWSMNPGWHCLCLMMTRCSSTGELPNWDCRC